MFLIDIIQVSFSREEGQRANKVCRLYEIQEFLNSFEFLRWKKVARVRLKGLNSLIEMQLIKLRKKSA